MNENSVFWKCDHCRQDITRRQLARVVFDERGMRFYHVEPDCLTASTKDKAHIEAIRSHELWRE